MKGFNLSAWAITHRPVVHYLMAVLVVLGIASYLKLGRNEDPTFTIKTMVVQAQWPGATLEDTLLQVTERIERKLQETPHLDYIKSYTSAGRSTVFVYLKGSTGPREVSDTWYQVRKKINDIELTLPQGVIGPVANDEFGDTYGIVYGFTADGFTSRELRDYVEDIRSRLLQVPDVSKVNLIGEQDERIYIEFSPAKLAGYGLSADALAAALRAQNAVAPSGVITTDQETIRLRVSGAFTNEKDILATNFAVGDRIVRLSDIAEVKRQDADPPEPMFRINGKPGLGLSISMRDGGDVLALGRNIEQTMQELKANLPIGIEPIMVANQPDTVSNAIGEFMEALWEAIGIVLVVSVVSLGLRAGTIVIISIPLVLAIVFASMEGLSIDLQRISLGALIIALGLLVDDAMITIESMVSRLERGDTKEQAAIFAYNSTALPRLTGTLVTIAGFLPVGFARSDAGEYTFSLFAVVALALLSSWVAIRSLQIPLHNGQVVPLRQIATFDYQQEYPIVWRRDRVPTLTVQADVVPGVLPATATQAVQPNIDRLAATLPSGYHIATGGSVEESGKAQASVKAVLPMAGLVVLTILMFQLQSFQRVLLVLSVAPLGLIGVVLALVLAQAPLGFVAILGVLALTGMIARNSVILIDQIQTEIVAGRHPWDAIVTAAIHRTRPILLTASAATLGMIPIAPTVFWGPMAFSIIGGLAVATVLTLIFLPALYVAWFRIAEPAGEATPMASARGGEGGAPPAPQAASVS